MAKRGLEVSKYERGGARWGNLEGTKKLESQQMEKDLTADHRSGGRGSLERTIKKGWGASSGKGNWLEINVWVVKAIWREVGG